MGAQPWPLPALLFGMITRFLLTQSARKCATPATPDIRGRRWSRPAMVRPNSRILQSREPPHRIARHSQTPTPVSDVPTHHNLGAELDRFRAGVQPISARNRTDLEPGEAPCRNRQL